MADLEVLRELDATLRLCGKAAVVMKDDPTPEGLLRWRITIADVYVGSLYYIGDRNCELIGAGPLAGFTHILPGASARIAVECTVADWVQRRIREYECA